MVTGDRADVGRHGRRGHRRRRGPRRADTGREGRRGRPRPPSGPDHHGRRRHQRRPGAGARRRRRRHRRPRRHRVVRGRRRRAHRRPARPARRSGRHRPPHPRIATQSVVAGIGLSLVAMAVAAAGYLPPAWGRSPRRPSTSPSSSTPCACCRPGRSAERLADGDAALARRFSAEHTHPATRPRPAPRRRRRHRHRRPPSRRPGHGPRACTGCSSRRSSPHEQAEDAQLYPVLARVLGGADPTGTMSRAHVEIAHQIRRLGRLLDDIDAGRPTPTT